MRFSAPWVLLALLVLPYFIWLGRPRPPVRDRWRRWLSLGLRLAIVSLLTLALAGTQLARAADELAVVFLVDSSDSITPEQAEQAESFVRTAMAEMGANDYASVIMFGGNALVDRPMSQLAELAPLSSSPQRLHTDLAEAIRLGLALFPSGAARRMVVLSDGAATLGNTQAAAELAAVSGVQIDYVPLLPEGTSNEAWLTAVDAPTRVSEGETFRIDVSAESTTNQAAALRLLADGAIVYSETVDLRAGSNNFTIRLQAATQSFSRYVVELVPFEDSYYQNNQLAAFTEVVGSPRILLVSAAGTLDDDGNSIPDDTIALRAALEAVGFAVDTISPVGLSSDLAALSRYASVVLVDVNAKNLAVRKMEALQSYVRDLGGGLVAIGGPNSYGMGGYFKTALEETLPVEMQIKDSERFPSVSVVIVIDRSGSMGAQEGGVTKIQLAAEGAVRVAQLLNAGDEITVIPVDTRPDAIIGPFDATDPDVVAAIRSIGAGGGGIFVRSGLQAASDALAETTNEVKHVIVLADGGDSEEKEGVPALLDNFAADNVTTSFVAIGDGRDVSWLRDMAELGNGRFHFTDQAANLPQIFTQETTNIQRNYLIEERFFPELVSRSPILSGINEVPPLFGYVGTSPKGAAQVVLRTAQEDPLLATWQYGLGRSVAWTSDATGRWASDWVQWPGYASFWAQTIRWTVSQTRDEPFETAVVYEDGVATLTVEARDSGNSFVDGLTLDANLVAPSGETVAVELQQTGPGRYAAEFDPTEEGAYLIRLSEAGSDVGQTAGWVLGYSPEYQQFQPQPTLLADIAGLTAGRDLTDQAELVFRHDLTAGRAIRPIAQPLLLAAVLLLPLDIATRRLVVTRRDWQRLSAFLFGRFRPAQPEPERSESVSTLLDVKRTVEARTEERREAAASGGNERVIGHQLSGDSEPVVDLPPAPAAQDEASSSGSLASQLLARKRSSREQNDES